MIEYNDMKQIAPLDALHASIAPHVVFLYPVVFQSQLGVPHEPTPSLAMLPSQNLKSLPRTLPKKVNSEHNGSGSQASTPRQFDDPFRH